jgi:hypothetical protein
MRQCNKRDTNMYDVREFYKRMPSLTPAKFWFDVMRNSRFKVEIINNTCRVHRND